MLTVYIIIKCLDYVLCTNWNKSYVCLSAISDFTVLKLNSSSTQAVLCVLPVCCCGDKHLADQGHVIDAAAVTL